MPAQLARASYDHADFAYELAAVIALVGAMAVEIDRQIQWLRGKAEGGARTQLKLLEELRADGEEYATWLLRQFGVEDVKAQGIYEVIQAKGGLVEFVAGKHHHQR